MRMVVVIGSPFPRRYLNYTFIALLDFKRIIFILLSLRRGFHPPPLSANCGVTGRWVYRPPCPERPLIKLSQTATGCRHSFFPVKRGTHRSGTLVAASWKEEEGETSIARGDVDDAHAKSHPSTDSPKGIMHSFYAFGEFSNWRRKKFFFIEICRHLPYWLFLIGYT